MIEVRQTRKFASWLDSLKDTRAKARIVARIARLRAGNFGDVKRIGNTVSELRVDYGPGYRLYFTVKDRTLVILLCGGDKRAQSADIAAAERMVEEL
jgi:putative addiction module killer protein